jgi:hypothetical protein
MAEIIGKARAREQHHELAGRIRGVGTLQQGKHQNFIFMLANKFIQTLKGKPWRNPDPPDAQSARKKDESDNQLWKIYHTQEFNNPRPPTDIFR